MMYKTTCGEHRRVKLAQHEVTRFFSAPSFMFKRMHVPKEVGHKAETFGVSDVKQYLYNAVTRGECIITDILPPGVDVDVPVSKDVHDSVLVTDDDNIEHLLPRFQHLIACTRCTFLISADSWTVIDVWKGGL